MVPKLTIRLFGKLNVLVYRISKGNVGGAGLGLPILLLTTTGRKSGKLRTTPLSYLTDGPRYVIIGSFGGHRVHPAWFHNLRADPQVTVQVKKIRTPMTARVATPEERKILWSRLDGVAPHYRRYQARTSREVPLVFLEPTSGS